MKYKTKNNALFFYWQRFCGSVSDVQNVSLTNLCCFLFRVILSTTNFRNRWVLWL